MASKLGRGELYAKAHNIGDNDKRQYAEKTIPEFSPEAHISKPECKSVLVSNIPHTKEHCRHKSHNHNAHNSFEVHTVPYVRTALCNRSRNKEK